MASVPAGFIPDKAAAVPEGFVPDAAPVASAVRAPEKSLYQRVAEPATQAIAKGLEFTGRGWAKPGALERPARAAAEMIVPQNEIEAGATIGSMAAGPLAPLVKAVPYLGRVAGGAARVIGGAVGGEIGGQVSGETPGKGAAIGGGGALLGEGVGQGAEIVGRALPGAKKAISLADTRRVGRDIADVTGAPAARTPTDLLDQATGAVTRQREGAAAHDAALAARESAVAQARQEARQATGGLQNTVDAMTRVVNERRNAEAAEGLHGVINRVSPQLAAALDAPGAQGLRNAGAGGARRVLGEGKEAVVRQLEEAAPGGIVVPALSDEPMPVRDALWALSEIGAGRGAQFARNPLDRNVLGAGARQQYGDVLNQIARGFDDVQRGLGDVFRQGQQTYREGLAVSKTLLEPNKNWTPTGDVNTPALARDIIKPRNRRALEDKLGTARYQEIAGTVAELPRPLPAQDAPRILPREVPEPVAPTRSAADVVMTALFGPANRIQQQGSRALVNWPAAQKAIQTPRVRAEIEAAVGPDGYQQILRSLLRGATEGADVPAVGGGGLLDPLKAWARGSNTGFWGLPLALGRTLAPNAGASYVGRKPMQLPAALQTILDVAGQRGTDAVVNRGR